jgi:hypothetical protein
MKKKILVIVVHRFAQLPEGIERGQNENAFLGGIRCGKPEEIPVN